MKPITTKIHGLLDYAMAFLLLATPFLFELGGDTEQAMVFYAFGAGALLYSLITDYEFGLLKLLPVRFHLLLDVLSGLLLASAPWIWDIGASTVLPYMVLGATEVVIALLTNPSRQAPSNLID